MSSKSRQKKVVDRWVPKTKSELTKIANHNGEASDEKPELKKLTKNASRLNNRIRDFLKSLGVDPRPKRMKATVDFICEFIEVERARLDKKVTADMKHFNDLKIID